VDCFTLADGSECIFDVYEAKVAWDGKVRQKLVDEADTDPLIGMRLLRGHELKMRLRARCKITIKRLPSRYGNGTEKIRQARMKRY
jgi:predicted aspartyl protease